MARRSRSALDRAEELRNGGVGFSVRSGPVRSSLVGEGEAMEERSPFITSLSPAQLDVARTAPAGLATLRRGQARPSHTQPGAGRRASDGRAPTITLRRRPPWRRGAVGPATFARACMPAFALAGRSKYGAPSPAADCLANCELKHLLAREYGKQRAYVDSLWFGAPSPA